MYMVMMAFHGKDINLVLPAGISRQSAEALLKARDIENLPPVPRAEYEVIVDQ